MKLLIVIPALNEEDSIQEIIERSLAARGEIIDNSPVTEVAITVVSDGSTDRTVEIARRHLDRINLIVFEKNRGYGAAIKTAWQQSDAELLGFLDADGTCDPRFFAPLCRTRQERGVDIILGCRLNADSRMPLIRRMGNTFFAGLLSLFSTTRVRDSASGMRVVHRDSLPRLLPLPDGLHFTPAMSARGVLADDLTIAEIDMPYQERQGESKLSVARDGLRFLKVILQTAFLYRPSILLSLVGLISLLVATGIMLDPIAFYIETRTVGEWMVYRFISGYFLGSMAVMFFCTGYLASRFIAIAMTRQPEQASMEHWLHPFFSHRLFWYVPLSLATISIVLVLPGLVKFFQEGAFAEHWSRFISVSFFFTLALILSTTRLLSHVLTLVSERVVYLRAINDPPR